MKLLVSIFLALVYSASAKNVPVVNLAETNSSTDASSNSTDGDIPIEIQEKAVGDSISIDNFERQQRFLNMLNPAITPQINTFQDLLQPFRNAPNVLDPSAPVNFFYPFTFLNPNLAENLAEIQNAAFQQFGSLLGMDLTAVGLPKNEIASNVIAGATNPMGNRWAAVLHSGLSLGQLQNEIVPTTNEALEPQINGITVCGRKNEGVCLSNAECIANGGKRIGSCLGCSLCDSCCEFKLGESSSTINQVVSSFSSNVPVGSQVVRKYTIRPKQGVCQIRLDFNEFNLPLPVNGTCQKENSLSIISTRSNILGEGNSRLCGSNKGHHIYLEAKKDQTIDLDFRIAAGGSRNVYRWDIKVTQVVCELHFNLNINPLNSLFPSAQTPGMKQTTAAPQYFTSLRAPDTCLQYYKFSVAATNNAVLNTNPIPGLPSVSSVVPGLPTAEKFELRSFNYDGVSLNNNNYDYNICIRRPVVSCGVRLTGRKFDVPVADPACKDGTLKMSGAEECCTVPGNGRRPGTREAYLGISAVSDGTALFGGQFLRNLDRDQFCGTKLGATNNLVTVEKDLVKIKVYSLSTVAATSAGNSTTDNTAPNDNPDDAAAPNDNTADNAATPNDNSATNGTDSALPTGVGFDILAEVIPGIC